MLPSKERDDFLRSALDATPPYGFMPLPGTCSGAPDKVTAQHDDQQVAWLSYVEWRWAVAWRSVL